MKVVCIKKHPLFEIGQSFDVLKELLDGYSIYSSEYKNGLFINKKYCISEEKFKKLVIQRRFNIKL